MKSRSFTLMLMPIVVIGLSLGVFSFSAKIVNALPLDSVPPVTAITNHINGDYVTGTAAITATANDDNAVDHVELWYSGSETKIGDMTETTPGEYSYDWDTTVEIEDGYAIWTEAYDTSANLGTSTVVNVTVDNSTPTISDASVSDATANTATLNFTTDEAGTYYYLVYLAPNGPVLGGNPGPAKIKAQGTAINKGTATTSAGAIAVSMTGLATSTGYNVFVIVEDAAGHISAVTRVPFVSLVPEVYVDDDYISGDCGGYNWGVNAFSSIQSGIDAVAENGTVNVAAGNYNENLSIEKKLSLIGDIGDDVLGPGVNAPLLYDDSCGNRTVNISASEVVIRGFTIENSSGCYPVVRIGTSIASTTISNNELRYGYTGITLSPDTHDNIITKNSIDNNSHGIFSNGSISNSISNNEIYSNSNNGIEVVGNKISGGNSYSSNNIHNNGNHGINLGGYLDTSAGIISIDSNTISLNSGAGIYINEGTSDISIENNTISNNGYMVPMTGIHVISAAGNSAHNNIISDDDEDVGINNEDVDNIFDASNNYWGGANGPYSDVNNPDGNIHASIVGNVKFRPYFTDEAMTTTSTVSVDSSNLAALFGNGGTFSVPDGESSTSATQLNVDEETIIGVVEGAGTSTVVLPAGITITRTDATGTIDASLLAASDIASTDLSGLTAGLVVEGAFQWGIPNLGLTFSSPITLNIYVGTALNGQTLTVYRSLSQSSGWETSGIVAPGTCVVASGICTFQTTKASYFAAAQSGSTGGSSGGGYQTADYTFKAPAGGVTIKVNNGSANTTARVVALDLYGGADAKNMAIANSADFVNAIQEPYNTVKTWTLTEGNGAKTVYVKFYNQYGYSSAAISGMITLSGQAADQTASAPSETVLPPANAISDSESAVVFSNISTASIQPGTMLKYSYSYKNDTAKTARLKITRQMLSSKKKVVFTTSASKNIKAGESFNRAVNQMISKYSVSGDYWIKVKVADLTNDKTYENSFKITIEKLKKKYFMMDGVATSAGPLVFSPNSLKRIKSNRALATYVGYTYSYANNSDKMQVLKLASDIISPSGKTLYSRSSKMTLLPGKKASKSTSQYLGSKLAAGKYKIRIRAIDWNTKEILAENYFNFSIDLK